MTIVDGGRTRSVVFDEVDALPTARRTAQEYVEAVLYEDDSPVGDPPTESD